MPNFSVIMFVLINILLFKEKVKYNNLAICSLSDLTLKKVYEKRHENPAVKV